MTGRAAIFIKRVGDLMLPTPPSVSVDTDCADLIARFVETGSSCILITRDDGRVVGLVTEQDVARRIVFQTAAHDPINEIMTEPVHLCRDDDYVYTALATMRRSRLRRLPVVNAAGLPVGLIDLHYCLEHINDTLIKQIDRISSGTSLASLRDLKAWQIALAGELSEENLSERERRDLIHHLDIDLLHRTANITLGQVASEGRGAPPIDFCIIAPINPNPDTDALAGEQTHGFILGDYPDHDHAEIESWFIPFAERLSATLEAAGMPPDREHRMAINPVWRKSIGQWKNQVARRMPKSTKHTASPSLFEFKSIFGKDILARELRDFIDNLATPTGEADSPSEASLTT